MNTTICIRINNTSKTFGHEILGLRNITLICIEFQDVIEKLFWNRDLIVLSRSQRYVSE